MDSGAADRQNLAVLTARGIRKRYGAIEALVGADLEVGAGQIVALLGRNGAGKSTLLSVIAGLVRPDEGSVSLDGLDALADPVAAAKLIGIAPQDTGIYPVLTVAENLRFFAEISNVASSKRSARIAEASERLGMAHLMDRRGSTLSGGEARRLHTACALLHRPRLLMLDEPTVGADVTTRGQLIEAVNELAAEGAAVIYTTHYLPEVELLDADVVVIDEGRIKARGRRQELVAAHHLHSLELEVADNEAAARLDHLQPEPLGGSRFRIEGEVNLRDVMTALGDKADQLVSFEVAKPDLENVFLAVTGTSLDDDTASGDSDSDSGDSNMASDGGSADSNRNTARRSAMGPPADGADRDQKGRH